VIRRLAVSLALVATACMASTSSSTPEVRMDGVRARPPDRDGLSVMTALAGCWRGVFIDGRTVIEERWTPPEAGLMLSTTRYFRDGRAVDFEFGLVRADSAGVLFLPHPRGRASEHAFRLTDSRPGHWTFEAPEHDYPRRILYRLEGTELEARIDAGADDPEPRRWRLEAVPCVP
jgi:hypothetical protein